MTVAEEIAARFLPPDPILDRRGKPVPDSLACVLGLLRILLTYGRHLSATLEHRATRRTFTVIAQFFGTSRLPIILARVARGVLRAVALERVLMERAARGRKLIAFIDPVSLPRRKRGPAANPRGKAPPDSRRRPRLDPDATLTLDNLPTVEELMAEIRRRRWIGRALIDICCDLGVGIGVCEANFGTALFQAMRFYRGSFPRYFKEMRRREQAYRNELDWNRQLNVRYDWPDPSRDGTRRGLGFFVGEDPVSPEPPATGAAPPAPADHADRLTKTADEHG